MMRQIPVWVKVSEQIFDDFELMKPQLTDSRKANGVMVAGPIKLVGSNKENKEWVATYDISLLLSFESSSGGKTMGVADGNRVHAIAVSGTVTFEDGRIVVPTRDHGTIYIRKFDRGDLANLPIDKKHKQSIKSYIAWLADPGDEEE